jgi:hypothetical protein
MKQSLDLSDLFIIAFVAIIFIAGVVMVYKFMKAKDF